MRLLVSLLLALLAAGCEKSGSAAVPPDDLVQFAWSGAVTPASARVNAKLQRESHRVRLLVSPRADLRDPIATPFQAATPEHANVVSFALTGLLPNTEYHYAIEADGEVDKGRRGSFRTFPDRPASFEIALGSCANTGSDHPV